MADARLRHPDPRVRFEVGDAEHLTLDETFDVAVSGLMLDFANDAERGVAAMRRAVTPDGLAAAYVWDHAGRMELLQHFSTAAATLDPAAHALDEAVRFASWNADHLSALWRAGASPCRADDGDRHLLPVARLRRLLAAVPRWPRSRATYLQSLDQHARTALRDAVRTRLPHGHRRLAARARLGVGRPGHTMTRTETNAD